MGSILGETKQMKLHAFTNTLNVLDRKELLILNGTLHKSI